MVLRGRRKEKYMSKIYCADVGCRFNNANGVCTARKVALSWHSVMTAWDGRQEFQRCKTREKSQKMREMEKKFEELRKEGFFNEHGRSE